LCWGLRVPDTSGQKREGARCPPPHPSPGPRLVLYRASGWSCAGRSGSCCCSSSRTSRSCRAESSDGANGPQTAPTKPVGFRTRAGLRSFNKHGRAAPQLQGWKHPRGWGAGWGAVSPSLHSHDLGGVELVLVSAGGEGECRVFNLLQLFQVRGVLGGTGDVGPLAQDLWREGQRGRGGGATPGSSERSAPLSHGHKHPGG